MAAIMVDLRGTIPPDVLLRRAQGAFGYSGHNRAKCPAPGYGGELVAAGGWYAIVFEDRANRALDGYQAGRDDATYCVADARKQKYPTGCLLVGTADFPARWSKISEYVRGFSEVVRDAEYVCGLYADGECIRGAKAAGYITVGWLTCSGSFPGSHDETGVDVKQRCAGESGQIAIPPFSIDTNYLLTPFIHAWGQPAHHEPVPTPKGPLMALSDQDQKDLLKMVSELHAQWIGNENDAPDETLRQLLRHTDKNVADIATGKRPHHDAAKSDALGPRD